MAHGQSGRPGERRRRDMSWKVGDWRGYFSGMSLIAWRINHLARGVPVKLFSRIQSGRT
jgi:hypothetical protein